MKSYEQITRELLQRQEFYLAEQKKKRKRAAGGIAGLCCLCLVVLLGFLIPETPDAVVPAASQVLQTEIPQTTAAPEQPHIVLHALPKANNQSMYIALMGNDFVPMSREEMTTYYGLDYMPQVPEDLQLRQSQSGIYRRNGGTGEIYHDADKLQFSNADQSRNLSLNVQKGRDVFVQFRVFDPQLEASVIGGLEVLFGTDGQGIFCAEFFYRDVGFLLYAEGLTQEEFVASITSLLTK